MANHKSSIKRIRSNDAKRITNRYQAKTMRNAIKDLRTDVVVASVIEKLPKVVAMVDKLAKKNVIHKNKAANLKSKLTKRANALAATSKAETGTEKKAEKAETKTKTPVKKAAKKVAKK